MITGKTYYIYYLQNEALFPYNKSEVKVSLGFKTIEEAKEKIKELKNTSEYCDKILYVGTYYEETSPYGDWRDNF